jgi:hypothetical protein
VRQLRRRPRLAEKSLADVRDVAEHLREHLDGDGPFELDVHALIDHPHAATADLAVERKIRRQGACACVEIGALVGHGLGRSGSQCYEPLRP